MSRILLWESYTEPYIRRVRKRIRKMKQLIKAMAAALVILQVLSINCECSTTKDKEKYIEYIEEICNEYDCSPELIQAIIERESTWNPNAKNGGCKGLMQINEKWHKERMKKLQVKSLYDPYGNILVGVDYIMELANTYEDIGTVLNIYNAGTNGLKLAKKGKYLDYTKKVIARATELQEEKRQ